MAQRPGPGHDRDGGITPGPVMQSGWQNYARDLDAVGMTDALGRGRSPERPRKLPWALRAHGMRPYSNLRDVNSGLNLLLNIRFLPGSQLESGLLLQGR